MKPSWDPPPFFRERMRRKGRKKKGRGKRKSATS